MSTPPVTDSDSIWTPRRDLLAKKKYENISPITALKIGGNALVDKTASSSRKSFCNSSSTNHCINGSGNSTKTSVVAPSAHIIGASAIIAQATGFDKLPPVELKPVYENQFKYNAVKNNFEMNTVLTYKHKSIY